MQRKIEKGAPLRTTSDLRTQVGLILLLLYMLYLISVFLISKYENFDCQTLNIINLKCMRYVVKTKFL